MINCLMVMNSYLVVLVDRNVSFLCYLALQYDRIATYFNYFMNWCGDEYGGCCLVDDVPDGSIRSVWYVEVCTLSRGQLCRGWCNWTRCLLGCS